MFRGRRHMSDLLPLMGVAYTPDAHEPRHIEHELPRSPYLVCMELL